MTRQFRGNTAIGGKMTLKDKLEIGLKEDAPFRKDNLPENQVRGRRFTRSAIAITSGLPRIQ